MLKYLSASQLQEHPELESSMYQDRAQQFSDRLSWEVSVNDRGEERDWYDEMNPLYVVWQLPNGRHGGSFRLMPTLGRTMLNDHFLDLTGGTRIESPSVWEVTRFCISQDAPKEVSGLLMLATVQFGCSFGIPNLVGVFGAYMTRVYRRLRFSPRVIGETIHGNERLQVGIWTVSDSKLRELCFRTGVALETSRAWIADLDAGWRCQLYDVPAASQALLASKHGAPNVQPEPAMA